MAKRYFSRKRAHDPSLNRIIVLLVVILGIAKLVAIEHERVAAAIEVGDHVTGIGERGILEDIVTAATSKRVGVDPTDQRVAARTTKNVISTIARTTSRLRA